VHSFTHVCTHSLTFAHIRAFARSRCSAQVQWRSVTIRS
jgi:hypothetical protein